MDHYATRYPTNVVDIANFLVRLSGSCLANSTKFLASLYFPSTLICSRASSVSDDLFLYFVLHAYRSNGLSNIFVTDSISLGHKKPIPPILHYSAAEPFTKYEICLVFAKILGLPHGHIIPDAEEPTGAGATTRPRNCELYTRETEELGVAGEGDGGPLGLSLFEEWWSTRLGN